MMLQCDVASLLIAVELRQGGIFRFPRYQRERGHYMGEFLFGEAIEMADGRIAPHSDRQDGQCDCAVCVGIVVP